MKRLLIVASMALAACQGDAPPPPAAPSSAAIEAEPGVLRLMGTGAMSPLALALGQAWSASGRAPRVVPRVVVEESVGSGGGMRAAADGAVDLGMISRPLSVEEQRFGLMQVTIARDAVVIAAHRAVPVDGLSRDELVALESGRVREFPDGARANVLMRDAGESANLALERVIPELTALREEVYRSGRLRVLYHDDTMGQALATTPGAIGVFSLGAVVSGRLPLKVLALDGVAPSVEALAERRWPATRDLAFVFRPDRRMRAAAFLAFATSAEGRRIAHEAGYLPLEERAP